MVRVVFIVQFSLIQHTVEHQVLCSIIKFMITWTLLLRILVTPASVIKAGSV